MKGKTDATMRMETSKAMKQAPSPQDPFETASGLGWP